jgi:hypothetical protein
VGDALIFVAVIASSLLPGSGAFVWKFLGCAQELLLLSLVNMHTISKTLIAFYSGLSFVHFSFFDVVLLARSGLLKAGQSYNELTDGSEFHPLFSGSLFLANMRRHIFLVTVTLVAAFASVVLASKTIYLRVVKNLIFFSGIICVVQVCFNDVILASLVQVKHFSFDNSQFYTLNCFVACIALMFETAFVCFCMWVVIRSKEVLQSHEFSDKYGVLTEFVSTTRPAVFTPAFHNIRVFATMIAVVCTSSSPVA